MDAAVERALDLITQRDWVAIREVLHPYLHWTRRDGSVVRGRRNLIAEVQQGITPPVPETIALRTGQIYRWTE